MNDIQIFTNSEFGELGVITIDDKEMFPATECARMLGYSDPYKAVKQHCKEKGWANHPVLTDGGTQQVKFIDEGNLYRLITHSKLPAAEKFESWIFDEVLPTIRKTGGYVSNEDLFINTYLPHADESTKLLFRNTLETIRMQNIRIESDRPRVLFANSVETSKTSILVGDLAKLIKQNGYDIGQKRLFEWLRENGYLMKIGDSKNMPTQRAMEKGLFEVKERTIDNPDGSIRITKTTKVTGKGQVYFINKFLY